jgi:hypothetical protein
MTIQVQQLSDRYYGLLCVQLLVSAVDIGLLAHLGSLNGYRDGKFQGQSLSVFLHQNMLQKSGRGRSRSRGIVDFFGGTTTIRRGNFLSSIGGFSVGNAQLLVRLLYHA